MTKLLQFLNKYPNQWHSIATDSVTTKELERTRALIPYQIEVIDHKNGTRQIRRQHNDTNAACSFPFALCSCEC